MDEFVEYEQNTGQEPPATKRKKKAGLWILLVLLMLCVLAAAAFFLTEDLRAYQQAQNLYETRNYQAAAVQFEALGDYEDAPQMAQSAAYEWAGVLMNQKQYIQALEVLNKLGVYKDSDQWIQQCHYELGREAMDAADYEAAIEHFTQAQSTKSAPMRLKEAVYERGHELFGDGEYAQAQEYFDRLEGEWPDGGGPHFVNFDEALDYISTQAETLPEFVTVVVENMPGSYILRADLLNATIQQRLGYQFATVNYNEKTKALTVKPSYYPGQRIIYAWKTGDFSMLTEDELETYQEANRLLQQAQADDPDPEAMELWIHDWICQNVEYDSPYEYVYPEDFVGLNELTCVGAILSGKANCQGYTDAFYLLGTMAGLDVYVIFGTVEEGGHCWNGVHLDGKTYTVDVTFDDTYVPESEYWTYIWYNNVLDLDEYSVLGGSVLFPNMVTRKDLSKTYYTRTGNVYEDLGDAAYSLLRQYRINGPGVYHAVVDSADRTADHFYKAVSKNMATAGVYSAQWYVDLYTYEEDTYIWVKWVEE